MPSKKGKQSETTSASSTTGTQTSNTVVCVGIIANLQVLLLFKLSMALVIAVTSNLMLLSLVIDVVLINVTVNIVRGWAGYDPGQPSCPDPEAVPEWLATPPAWITTPPPWYHAYSSLSEFNFTNIANSGTMIECPVLIINGPTSTLLHPAPADHPQGAESVPEISAQVEKGQTNSGSDGAVTARGAVCVGNNCEQLNDGQQYAWLKNGVSKGVGDYGVKKRSTPEHAPGNMSEGGREGEADSGMTTNDGGGDGSGGGGEGEVEGRGMVGDGWGEGPWGGRRRQWK
ncbi:hypothetical protein B9Z19DRAFT_1111596 [Tuber borchii]|uniref:Uncharacterized protein n=1 Tax=Tuber borchii TaxID=42251 RepID=A0A2T6ZB75_TUBBO|nr:hypothetical protein B9Z19DRAFT_1111596 [Tuber borchii]